MENFSYTGSDGAHWCASQPYEDFVVALRAALNSCSDFDTGWLGVKKEIQSFRISRFGTNLKVEVSCSDDFDTEGLADKLLPLSASLDDIRLALAHCVQEADQDRNENTPVILYTIGRDNDWTYTYLQDASEFDLETPPGDYYHRWGWQEVELDDDGNETTDYPAELGESFADRLEAAIFAMEDDSCEVDGWCIRRVE